MGGGQGVNPLPATHLSNFLSLTKFYFGVNDLYFPEYIRKVSKPLIFNEKFAPTLFLPHAQSAWGRIGGGICKNEPYFPELVRKNLNFSYHLFQWILVTLLKIAGQ